MIPEINTTEGDSCNAAIAEGINGIIRAMNETVGAKDSIYESALKAVRLFAKESTAEVTMPMFVQFCKDRIKE